MRNGSWPSGARVSGNLENGRTNLIRLCGAGGAALVALLFLPALLAAKKKPPVLRSISGEVMNAASNGVDGATVELTDLQTNKTLASYTLNGGHYSFDGLDPHHDYQVQAKFQNKISRVRTVSSVSPFNQVVINLTLAPAKP
ncbi:MAG TPA: carboxypeptidase-like regulatory domain-containing protein [Terriglobia bacterium]|nr:carboxypeptidase-like regulatory domain-containing protein [Terriglobia bacterium]